MKSSKRHSIIPENLKGKKTDISSEVSFSDQKAAVRHFSVARQRLLNIRNWHQLSGLATADFKLTDASGAEVFRQAEVGDLFKIDIPGPGNSSGGGNDWVRVEAVEEKEFPEEDFEYLLIKVRPATNPNSEKTDTAHFFTDEANSYFMVKREKNTVSAEVHGRNELPNTKAESLTDKIRNTIVAIGAIFGFSNAQWKSLTKGIVNKNH